MTSSPITCAGLESIASRYDAILCDLWGVVHDGVHAYEAAGEALARFRSGGGKVVFVSNFPRRASSLSALLASLGARPDSYDAIVTSGDVTLDLMRERGGAPFYHIGSASDAALFDGRLENPSRLSLVDAAYVVCTSLVNMETETPDDYADIIDKIAIRGLDMICANPDLVVHRGEALLWCAGALAAALVKRGGTVIHAGKPHPPIYAKAISLLSDIPRDRVLAIGDAFATDVSGATQEGIDTLLVTHGIHRGALHPNGGDLDVKALDALIAEHRIRPAATMRNLSW